MPVFIANGDSDPMILPHYSYLLAGLIPHARVKIYPDSAHGFLFQHHAEFAADVEALLHEAGWTSVCARGAAGRSPATVPHVRSVSERQPFRTGRALSSANVRARGPRRSHFAGLRVIGA